MQRRLTPALAACLAVVALLGAAVPVPAAAQSFTESPAWLSYEQGKELYDTRQFGKALQAFKDAVSKAGIFPEAEMSIGDIYREEGEFALALRQYEKAYNLRNALTIPSTKTDILYRIATLYEDQELYNQMETRLLAVLQDEATFSGPQSALLKDQVEKNYVNNGFDRVLTLYRFDSAFAATAHEKLGWLYYRTGRYPQAIQHLLYAVIIRGTEVDTFLKTRDSEFAFASLKALLDAIVSNRDVSSFIQSTPFFSDLYYLASATNTIGRPQLAAGVWTQLAALKEAGDYAVLSARQLRKPFVGPLLRPPAPRSGSSGR